MYLQMNIPEYESFHLNAYYPISKEWKSSKEWKILDGLYLRNKVLAGY